jgi:hypothetical protein
MIEIHQENAHLETNSTKAKIYRALNGTPAENMYKLLDWMHQETPLFKPDDIIVIKPNLQWFNQGAPNIASVKALISWVFQTLAEYSGEIVLAENNHLGPSPWKKGGWATYFVRNSNLDGINNYNELVSHLKDEYGSAFSVCHWIDIDDGGKRVYSPADGTGYVLCDGTGGIPLQKTDNGLAGDNRRETIMSYPIFKTARNTFIDFKCGVWKNGSYTGQDFKFINLAALNHHSAYCGATSAVKNLFGVCDLSGGSNPAMNGHLLDHYYNFHSFAFNKWSPGPVPGMVGRAVGTFMKTIRKPFINITTAEWTGLSSRTETPVAHTKAVLASNDPVALDYHAAKYILYPNSRVAIHNPDSHTSPLAGYLMECANITGDNWDETNHEAWSYDVHNNKQQDNGLSSIRRPRIWGKHVKPLIKYFVFRSSFQNKA